MIISGWSSGSSRKRWANWDIGMTTTSSAPDRPDLVELADVDQEWPRTVPRCPPTSVGLHHVDRGGSARRLSFGHARIPIGGGATGADPGLSAS